MRFSKQTDPTSKLDTAALNLACYELARTIRWKDSPVDEVLARAMVERYVREVMRHEQYLVDQDHDPNFLVRAVRYLTVAHVIPPLEGNMEWFRSALDVIIELRCPISRFDEDQELFFREIEEGIAAVRRDYGNQS